MSTDDSMPMDDHSPRENNSPVDVSSDAVLPRTRLYSTEHKGPYFVYIRESKNGLCHLKITKYLFANYKEDIIRVDQVNKHKLKVIFKSANKANELPFDDSEVLQPYRVYIPAEHVEIDGLVFLSPEDSPEDLLNSGVGKFDLVSFPDVKVIDVFRFQNKQKATAATGTKVSSNDKVPSSLVRVTFPGTVLPNKLAVDGLLLPIKPYSRQVMFCEHCLRTGHTAKYCVVKPRCVKCGANHESKVCDSTETNAKCHLCSLNHDLSDRKACPKIVAANLKFQSAAKKRAKLTYAEAVGEGAAAGPFSNNPFDILSTAKYDKEFEAESTQPLDGGRKRRKVVQNHAKPSSRIQSKQEAGLKSGYQHNSGTKKSQQGESSKDHQPSLKTNTPSETISHFLKPIVINVISQTEISSELKSFILIAVNYFFDNLFPFCYSIIEKLLCNLLSTSNDTL